MEFILNQESLFPKVDWTKPVKTLAGERVRVLCTDKKCQHGYVVEVLVEHSLSDQSISIFKGLGYKHKTWEESRDYTINGQWSHFDCGERGQTSYIINC